MILILTDKNDAHANHVIEKISERGLPYFRFNLDVNSLLDTRYTFRKGNFFIVQHGIKLDISGISVIWSRRTFVELLLEESYDQDNDFRLWKNEWNKTLTGIYNSLKKIPWLNPWRIAYAAENKYLQMEIAARHGLIMPETLISNDKIELLQFQAEQGPVVLKLMNQEFYKTGENQFKGLYVNKLKADELDAFVGISENPIVWQKYIEKSFEVCYTVVGTEQFVCKIDSQLSKIANVDWRRYDIANTPHSQLEPPAEIKNKVDAMMKDLGIEYGALDFIVDKTGNLLFLEVNAMGQFLWIESLTELKISDAIVSWLENKINLKTKKYESILN